MDSPNFGTRMNIEKRENFVRITPGNDNHSRPAVAYDLLQQGRNFRIWVGLIALDMEWRQRSVVIDQQYRLRGLGESLQKRRELLFHFWPQRAAPFSCLPAREPRNQTAFDLARIFSCMSSGASKRTSQSSVIRFPAQR